MAMDPVKWGKIMNRLGRKEQAKPAPKPAKPAPKPAPKAANVEIIDLTGPKKPKIVDLTNDEVETIDLT